MNNSAITITREIRGDQVTVEMVWATPEEMLAGMADALDSASRQLDGFARNAALDEIEQDLGGEG